MTNLEQHAKEELKRAGLFDKDSDYEGMLGESILELIKVFAKQGHSGFSASIAVEVFSRLARYKTLTPITNSKEDWVDVTLNKNEPKVYQNRRDPSAFSYDGGRTYYLLDEVEKRRSSRAFKIKKFLLGLIGVKIYGYEDVMRIAPDAKNKAA